MIPIQPPRVAGKGALSDSDSGTYPTNVKGTFISCSTRRSACTMASGPPSREGVWEADTCIHGNTVAEGSR